MVNYTIRRDWSEARKTYLDQHQQLRRVGKKKWKKKEERRKKKEERKNKTV